MLGPSIPQEIGRVAQWNLVSRANILFSSPIAPIMSNSAHNISHEEIVELQKKFGETKFAINSALAVMMARADRWRRFDSIKKGRLLATDIETRSLLSEMSQGRDDYSEKLASTVLTKAPQVVSSLQEFTQALNETAGPELQKKFSKIKLAIINADILNVHPVKDQQSPVIARLKKGERVLLLEEEQDWAKVEWLNDWQNDTAGGDPRTGWAELGKLCFPRTRSPTSVDRSQDL